MRSRSVRSIWLLTKSEWGLTSPVIARLKTVLCQIIGPSWCGDIWNIYYFQYLMIVSFLASLTAILITSILLLLAWIISKRSKVDREKHSAFECGFDPIGLARIPFSTRFFLLAVIFLIFDVEIVLLFPIIRALTTDFTPIILIGSFSFLLVLILGLLHEWNEGSLEWAE